jgi:hypothetical protein
VKKLATFGYVVGVFLPRKFNLISKNFYIVNKKNEKKSFSNKSQVGMCCDFAPEVESLE